MNLKVISVHGVLLGEGLGDIPCNALCEPPTHCSLSYHTKPVSPIVKALRFALTHPGVQVVNVRTAPEAPAPGPEFFEVRSGSAPADYAYPYLVYWRARSEL